MKILLYILLSILIWPAAIVVGAILFGGLCVSWPVIGTLTFREKDMVGEEHEEAKN